MRIVIYGLGRYTEKIALLIKKTHSIVAYSDSFSEIKTYGGKKFLKADRLISFDFDYIVVTVADRKLALEICADLNSKYFIPKEKIIPFFVYSHKTEAECNFYKMKTGEFEGVILGNSHARYGIDEKLLPHKYINLSSRSQDLYCNKKICQMLEREKSLSKSLKYAIVDLFDYNTLNIDNSRGRGIFEYISLGGIIDLHNFHKNNCFATDFKTGLRQNGYIDIHKELIDKIFYDTELLYGELYDEGWRGKTLKNGLEEKNILSAGISIRNEETINENKNNLRELVSSLRRINSNMRVYFTMIPRYKSMEKIMEKIMPSFWQDELEEEIRKISDREECKYLNYKHCSEIYGNKNFFMDPCHLNSIGARALTYKLVEDL